MGKEWNGQIECNVSRGDTASEDAASAEQSVYEIPPAEVFCIQDILQECPECGGKLTGIIEIGPDYRWLKDCRRMYDKHRCLLRYVKPREYYRECFPNRFCQDCGFEWFHAEGLLKRDRYDRHVFDKEEYFKFLEDTEFSFEPYLINGGKKHRRLLSALKNLWNSFFGRIIKIR